MPPAAAPAPQQSSQAGSSGVALQDKPPIHDQSDTSAGEDDVRSPYERIQRVLKRRRGAPLSKRQGKCKFILDEAGSGSESPDDVEDDLCGSDRSPSGLSDA